MPTLGIDFGGTEIKLGLLDGPEILASAALPNLGNDNDLHRVRDAADDLTATRNDTVSAVAIALPGVIDRASSSLVAAHGKYGYLRGLDLSAWVREAFGIDAVAIENDARAALLGEAAHGVAAGAADAVLITLGTGIGTAALVHGQVLRGVHDHAGILGGHVTVDLDGPICNCGNTGCAEAVASTWALQRDVASDAALTRSTLGDRAARGVIGLRDLVETRNETAPAALFDRYLRAWGAAIVNLCHAYDPDVVVVAGGVMRSTDVILPALSEYVSAHLWSSSHRPVFVTPSAPEHSVLLGLSALAERIGEPTDIDREGTQ